MLSCKMMKAATPVWVGAVALVLTFSASAAPCPALQYEELKDMSPEELSKEFCAMEGNAAKSWGDVLDMRRGAGMRGDVDEAAAQALDSEGDQCHNQAERIKRVLSRKGVDTSGMRYDLTCKGKKL